MFEEEIIEQFKNKKDIDKIFEIITSKKIIKTTHFYDRLLFRDLEEQLINENLLEKQKIKLIDKRRHKKDIGYDIHYSLSGNRTLKLCFIPLRDKTLLINAILIHRRWQNSIRDLSNKR